MKETSVIIVPVLVLLIIFSVATAGCSSQAPAANPVPQSPATLPPVTPLTTPAGNAPETEASIGEPVSNAERHINVTSVYKTQFYTGRDSTGTLASRQQAPGGSAFVVVGVEAKSTGPGVFFPGLDFTLTNPEGTKHYGRTFWGKMLESLSYGQSAGGEIVFTVPADATDFTLSYEFGNVSGGPRRAYWKLNFISQPMTVSETKAAIIPTSMPVTPAGNPDAAFIDASEKCFNETPVIGNLTTEIAFISCFQKTPKPVSECAQVYRQNILRYTTDDTTTAGFNRMNSNIQQLRTMYFDGVWWDVLRYGWFPCEGHEGGFVPVTYHQDD